ncbi:phytanoyl-CoA dioxygenase family protein [Synechococcus sp. A10-1-5-1]|uniref:phytanoyl-CoA dioxygenase family protein n=1 Tax=Synechococcus sp. A10-1-5-1 TaxID=2936507 RepID=UPI0020012822|nr:phytanoyl-CoA dioxygenase family protein [Synechococcus sp. A10-1-5-1]UPM49172.1 phytanoyl-CoA dioxygenase family protein [Synechococcus sp. A10-1-5-1]
MRASLFSRHDLDCALGADRSRPLIDRSDCLELVATGVFGTHSGRALQLHRQGFCLLRPKDPQWLSLLDQVRLQLETLVDLSLWRTGADARIRISEGWRNPGTPAVKALALHPEILDVLRCCYGREPFAFQTLNFPVGSNQPIHSDATHFHSEPEGFMAGVWVALEDVTPDAGPLLVCPGSHRLPYVSAADLGLTREQIQAEAHPQRLFEPYWQEQLQQGGFEPEPFLAKRGDVLIWHANLLHGGAPVIDHQLSRWSQVSHYLFEGCRFCSPMQSFGQGRRRWKQQRDLATGQWRPTPAQRLKQLILPAQPVVKSSPKPKALDLSGCPLIDAPHCEALAASGCFGEHTKLALELHHQGFGTLKLQDPHWLDLVDQLRGDLEPLVDLEALSQGRLPPQRFQDAWLHLGIERVRQLACHPEILAALRVLYGRDPFPFQTLNFPNGTAQHFHSDAVHFHSLPHGFMCGIWVALEDIQADAGPLLYYPGSHREPYLSARDLGISKENLKAEIAPQRLFEPHWRNLVQHKGYREDVFLARKGEVLIWHANLLHGGSAVCNKRRSRWSQVSHYYFRGCGYTTPLLHTSDADLLGDQWRLSPLDLSEDGRR